jgi:hypothetical protein
MICAKSVNDQGRDSVLNVLENITMELGAEGSLVREIGGKELILDGVINGLVEILFELGVPDVFDGLAPLLNGGRVRRWEMDGQCLFRTGRKLGKTHRTQGVWHQVRHTPVIPVKPGDHSTIAHGPEVSLNAQYIANPTRDVVRIPGVESIVCGMIDQMARDFGSPGIPNGILLSFRKTKARHGSGATPQNQRL